MIGKTIEVAAKSAWHYDSIGVLWQLQPSLNDLRRHQGRDFDSDVGDDWLEIGVIELFGDTFYPGFGQRPCYQYDALGHRRAFPFTTVFRELAPNGARCNLLHASHRQIT